MVSDSEHADSINEAPREEQQPAPVAPTEEVSEPVTSAEPSPLEGLLDEMDALKQKVAQLEQFVVAHGHSFDDNSISQIAQHVFKRINDAIRMRGKTS